MNRFGTTHLMLRVALMGTALAIVASVVYEYLARDCWLTSISAYWYTDARAVFAGGLVALGISLVVYAGGTWTENLLLNLAGMLAPIVAFAPTRVARGHDVDCLGFKPNYDMAATDNGLTVYFICLIGGVVVAAVASSGQRQRLKDLTPTQRRAGRMGIGIGVAIPLGILAWRLADPDFAIHVHFPAAVVMFVFLTGVVALRIDSVSAWSRAWDLYRDDPLRDAVNDVRTANYSLAYGAVAVGMASALGLAGLSVWFGWWQFTVVVAEFALLILFLTFWLLQTLQLRGVLRTGEKATPETSGRSLA
jgi:hypothetical protein